MAMILTLNYIGRPIIDALDQRAGETREDINNGRFGGGGIMMRRSQVVRVVVLAFILAGVPPQVHPAASGAGEILEKEVPIQVTEVAPGLYFQYHHQEANNAFLVTDDGVLVIDTRQHPKRAEELVATIRKYTDKPIRWVVNTHAHGDQNEAAHGIFQAA
jgi:alkyl sulfatase BDS1-like metallo-beta-lactamase superfamily hydrolase